jgi:uncharacterized protein (UPF0332 family)/predicted nucleotidyltransferase
MVRAQPRYEEAAREYTRQLLEERPDVVAVVLYGSVARGEAGDDSDVDLMILAAAEDDRLTKYASGLAMKIGEEYGAFVQEIVESLAVFESRALEGYPFQRKIVRGGLALFDRGDFARIRAALPPPPSPAQVAEGRSDYRPGEDVINDLLASLDQALADAELLLASRSWDGASNRAYYAMFNAASAAVLCCGVEELRSHRAVIDLFGKHVVYESSFDRAYLSDLNEVFKLRLRADYERGFHVDVAAAGAAVGTAARFTAAVRQFVSRR